MMDEKLPTHQQVPHRAPGYPELAFLISTDVDFSIFRKFAELSARNLLTMQAELIHIEDELRFIDDSEAGGEHVARRQSLFSQLETLMGKYQKALILQHHVYKLGTPKQDMADKYDHWIHNAASKRHVDDMKRNDFQPNSPIPRSGRLETPSHYWRTQDYILLKSPIIKDTWIERFTRNHLGRWFKDARPIPPNYDGYYFSRSKVERVKDWLAYPLGIIFLLAPALLFFFICSPASRLAILLSFIAGLALVVQIFLGTTRHETLATALAYTGVLGLLITVKTDRCPLSK